MPNIKITHLCVTYLNKKVYSTGLDDVAVNFSDHSFNIVLGASGSGKTTFLKTIAGLIDYDGDILFNEKDVYLVKTKDRNISFLTQNYVLYPNMNIFENIAFPLATLNVSEKEIIERVNEIAEVFDIKLLLSRKPRQLSGGQQQLVALAKSLVKKPDILLLDEPFSNIAQDYRNYTAKIVYDYAKKYGITVILSTHQYADISRYADKIIVLENGKIIFDGTDKELSLCHDENVTRLIDRRNIEDVL